MHLEELILKEQDYTERMNAEVEPYLDARRSERWVTPSAPVKQKCKTEIPFRKRKNAAECVAPSDEEENTQEIHLTCYRADEPKAAVVISHGFTEAEPKYHEVVYYFLKQQFNVYVPEHCGHGKSYRLTSDPSLVHIDRWERYAADLIRVSRLTGRENPNVPLYLYGHSMGGGIAAAAASLAPELYERVVLSSPMIRPLTAKIPWGVSAMISHMKRFLRKGEDYVTGQKPYAGAETFSESGGVSKPRFLRYDVLRQEHTELQTCAASYGWLYESLRMSGYLLTSAYQDILAPVLILRPQEDAFVSVEAQDWFAEAMNRKGQATCELEEFADVKHELFNSGDDVLQRYWGRVFDFLQ